MSSRFGASHIDHVTIITHDLARARDFFSRVLQLVEVPRPESFDFPGAWFQIGPNVLHLLEKPQRDTTSARHFCIWVTDIRGAAEHAKTMGCDVAWQLKHKIPGIDRFFLNDPDGNRIEIQGSDTAGRVA